MSSSNLPIRFIRLFQRVEHRRLHYHLAQLTKKKYSNGKRSSIADGPDLSFFTGLSSPTTEPIEAVADLPYLDQSSWDGGHRKGLNCH